MRRELESTHTAYHPGEFHFAEVSLQEPQFPALRLNLGDTTICDAVIAVQVHATLTFAPPATDEKSLILLLTKFSASS